MRKINGREVEFGMSIVVDEYPDHIATTEEVQKQIAFSNIGHIIQKEKGEDVWIDKTRVAEGRTQWTGQLFVFTKAELNKFVHLIRNGEL